MWGIAGIERSSTSAQHVLVDKAGVPVFDRNFILTADAQRAILRACQYLSSNATDLVQPGTVDCVMEDFKNWVETRPEWPPQWPPRGWPVTGPRAPYLFRAFFREKSVPPERLGFSTLRYGQSNGPLYVTYVSIGCMTYTNMGLAAFKARYDFAEFERLADRFKRDADGKVLPELASGFQTSDFWVRIFIEIVAVAGAVWGTLTSCLLCFSAIVFYTGSVKVSLLMGGVILAVVLVVVGSFFAVGWELGAVEAISLSILVGTSSDYASHIVGAFLLSGRDRAKRGLPWDKAAQVVASMAQIGVPVFSSSVTTIGASFFLLFCDIQLFGRFGSVVMISTVVSVVFSLIVLPSLLVLFAPPPIMRPLWMSLLWSLLVLTLLYLAIFGALASAVAAGVTIVGPSGQPIFSK